MLKYCKRCVMPDTKPDLHLDERRRLQRLPRYERRTRGGLGPAPRRNCCGSWNDTAARWQQLGLHRARQRRQGQHLPGGAHAAAGDEPAVRDRHHLRPVRRSAARTSRTSSAWAWTTSRSRPNPLVRAKLNRIGLTQVGDISWPEHVGIFTIPVRAAVQFSVPLIVWGENSQNEYGGPAAAARNNVLTRRWLEEFGGLLGLRVSDLIGQDGIEAKHLIPYTYPQRRGTASASA